MTSAQQRAALQRQIWQIANDVRGAVDGWDFKQYVLGTLFYRFISENFASYIEADDDSVNYAELPDSVITSAIKDDAIKTKGYFIYPSQLFATVAASANTNESPSNHFRPGEYSCPKRKCLSSRKGLYTSTRCWRFRRRTGASPMSQQVCSSIPTQKMTGSLS
jgi:type I restriction-modification system DNA methylase subunit